MCILCQILHGVQPMAVIHVEEVHKLTQIELTSSPGYQNFLQESYEWFPVSIWGE